MVIIPTELLYVWFILCTCAAKKLTSVLVIFAVELLNINGCQDVLYFLLFGRAHLVS